jgi:hypothetical protein
MNTETWRSQRYLSLIFQHLLLEDEQHLADIEFSGVSMFCTVCHGSCVLSVAGIRMRYAEGAQIVDVVETSPARIRKRICALKPGECTWERTRW